MLVGFRALAIAVLSVLRMLKHCLLCRGTSRQRSARCCACAPCLLALMYPLFIYQSAQAVMCILLVNLT